VAQRRLSVILDIDTGRGTARLTEAGKAMRTFGLDTKRAADNVKSMGSSFDSLHAGMQRPLQRLRDYVLILGNMRFALMNVRDLAVGWVAGLVKQSAELERLTILMKGFSHAATEAGKNEEAQNNLRTIINLANRTGFEMKTVTDAFVKFQSADLNPQLYSIRGLAQAVAKFGGDSDTMHRAAIAIQQMAGKGVISMEELRQQLGEAVPSALKTLAAAMGMTVQEMVKKISQGTVAAKPAIELMLKDMEITSAGAGDRIANSMFGQIAQVKTGLLQLSADFTQLGSQDGFFTHIENNLKELNQALRSPQAKEAITSLGKSVDSVAGSLASALKWVVEWRNEIGGLGLAIAKVWLAFKAIDIGAWFARMAQQAVVSLVSVVNGTREMTGLSGDLARWGQSLKQSLDQSAAATERWVMKTRERVVAAEQSIVATRSEIASLQSLKATYEQNILILTQQRAAQVANLRTAQTLNAANIAMGRDTAASSQMVKAEQDAVNASTRALIAQRRLLAATDAQLVTAEEQLTLALNEESIATARATTASELNTAATGAMALAQRGAAIAASFLGTAVNLILGPIGIAITLAYSAATAFGMFATKARDAANETRGLTAAIANMQHIKKLQEGINEIDDKLQGKPGTLRDWVRNAFGGDRTGFIDSRESLQSQKAELQKQMERLIGPANANQGRDDAQALSTERENYMDRLRERSGFQTQWQSLTNRILAGDKSAVVEMQRLRDQDSASDRQYLQGQINRTQRLLDNARKSGRTDLVQRYASQMSGLRTQMESAGLAGAQSMNLVTDALNGKGGGLAGAAAAAGKRVGKLKGDIAGLQAQVAGDKSTHLKQFMAAVAGGAYAGKSPGEIALLRQKAALQDAVIDGRAAQKEQEQYANAIGRVLGRIAELNIEMTGAKGNLAKFNAELAAGMHSNWSPDQIEKYRAALAQLDETEGRVDIAKAFKDADKQMSKAKVDADALWTSLANGTFLADQKAAELQGRFAHLLDGLKGEDLQKMQDKINGIIRDVQRADAAKAVFDWTQESQKIMNGLKEENAAREANYNLEVERQRSLIAWDKLSVEERIKAEAAFGAWQKAFRLQTDRENEVALVKQAREWYKLGTNIQGALAGALSSFTEQLSDGSFKFGKFAEDIIKSLFKIILQATIAYGILSALGMTNGQSYGSFLRQGVSSGFSIQAPTHHTGGVIGQSSNFKTVSADLFANAFKYHGGGTISKLGPKEVPMIGLEGERVLTEDQQKHLGTQPKVTVNVINNGGQDMDADVSTEFNGKEMIVSVVLDALSKQGRLRDAVGHIAKQ
jgi:tape measure domain-containing protein